MKRILYIILFLLPLVNVFPVNDSLYMSAPQNDTLYSSAIKLYETGQYEESLKVYIEILSRGIESPLMYYNMGNAAYRSNHLGYSVLYYEKALKMDPGFDDAAYNLKFVSQFKSDKFEEVPELFIRKWIRAAINGLSEKTWSLISILVFVLLLSGVMTYIFARSLAFKKTGFFLALLSLLIFSFSILSASVQHRKISDPDKGIVIAPSVMVNSTPSESGNDLFILHEGTKVTVGEEVMDWYNIRIADGREGWIPVSSFLPI